MDYPWEKEVEQLGVVLPSLNRLSDLEDMSEDDIESPTRILAKYKKTKATMTDSSGISELRDATESTDELQVPDLVSVTDRNNNEVKLLYISLM